MANPKYVKWLLNEMEQLQSEGLLTAAQLTAIQQRYSDTKPTATTVLTTYFFGILATLFVSGGVLLIIAYNWDQLSITWRSIFSFLPLLAGLLAYTFVSLKHAANEAFAEISAAFLSLMLLGSFALVSQTFHWYNDMGLFIWTWLLLSIPIIYLRPSILTGLIVFIGTIFYASQVGEDQAWRFWILILACLPILNSGLTNHAHLFRMWIGYIVAIAFPIGWLAIIEFDNPIYVIVGLAVLSTLWWLIGQYFFSTVSNWLQRPFEVVGFLIQLILTIILSYDLRLQTMTYETLVIGENVANAGRLINFAAMISMGLSILFLLSSARITFVWHYLPILVFPLLALLYLTCNQLNWSTAAVVIANIYWVAWGTFYLVRGILMDKMAIVNLGMLLLVLFLSLRFFDADWSFLVKGIAFVALGIGFWMANWRISRFLELKRAEQLINK